MSRIAKAAALTAVAGAALAGTAGVAAADSGAKGVAAHSPGVISGNVIQAPIHIPVNLCGNTVNVFGALNPAIGNTCINADRDHDNRHDGHGDYRHDDHGDNDHYGDDDHDDDDDN